MQYAHLAAFFGGSSKAASALGIRDRQRVDAWKKKRIPTYWQLKAAAVSGGQLVADEEAVRAAEELYGFLQQARAAASEGGGLDARPP